MSSLFIYIQKTPPYSQVSISEFFFFFLVISNFCYFRFLFEMLQSLGKRKYELVTQNEIDSEPEPRSHLHVEVILEKDKWELRSSFTCPSRPSSFKVSHVVKESLSFYLPSDLYSIVMDYIHVIWKSAQSVVIPRNFLTEECSRTYLFQETERGLVNVQGNVFLQWNLIESNRSFSFEKREIPILYPLKLYSRYFYFKTQIYSIDAFSNVYCTPTSTMASLPLFQHSFLWVEQLYVDQLYIYIVHANRVYVYHNQKPDYRYEAFFFLSAEEQQMDLFTSLDSEPSENVLCICNHVRLSTLGHAEIQIYSLLPTPKKSHSFFPRKTKEIVKNLRVFHNLIYLLYSDNSIEIYPLDAESGTSLLQSIDFTHNGQPDSFLYLWRMLKIENHLCVLYVSRKEDRVKGIFLLRE